MAQPPDSDFSDWDERWDLAPLARAALWGGFAVLAAFGVVLAARSEGGSQRVAAFFDTISGTHAAAQPAASGDGASETAAAAETEIRLLTDSVRALTADRERLLARLDAIERSLEHTGSVAATAEDPNASHREAKTETARGGDEEQVMNRAARPEFGLDLGPERSLETLRGLWITVKAQHGAALEGLSPLAMIREDSQTGGLELRLIAGPLRNASAAARLCMVISATGRPCRPAPFEGQRLALR